jgi:hypothetical protein
MEPAPRQRMSKPIKPKPPDTPKEITRPTPTEQIRRHLTDRRTAGEPLDRRLPEHQRAQWERAVLLAEWIRENTSLRAEDPLASIEAERERLTQLSLDFTPVDQTPGTSARNDVHHLSVTDRETAETIGYIDYEPDGRPVLYLRHQVAPTTRR